MRSIKEVRIGDWVRNKGTGQVGIVIRKNKRSVRVKPVLKLKGMEDTWNLENLEAETVAEGEK